MPGEGEDLERTPESDQFVKGMEKRAQEVREKAAKDKKTEGGRSPSHLEGSRRAEAIRTYKKAQAGRKGRK